MSNPTSLVDVSAQDKRLAEKIDGAIAGGLAVTGRDGGAQFRNAGEVMEFAKMMAVSHIGVRKHLRGNPGACLSVLMRAIGWRMDPFAVANQSYLVNDQIAFESQMIQAVILQRAPIRGRFRFVYDGEGQKRRCTVSVRTLDGDEVSLTTPTVGEIPVKNSPLWKGDPDQQLSYYAGRALCRRYFPDVLLGVYSVDEVEMYQPRDPDQARDITPRPQARTIAGRIDELAGDSNDNGFASADDRRDASTDEGADATSSKPTTAPSSEALSDAERRGVEDCRDGIPKRAVPAEYKADEDLKSAWLKGWNSENSNADRGE